MGQDSKTLHTFECNRCSNTTPWQSSYKPPNGWYWLKWPWEGPPTETPTGVNSLCPDCIAAFFEWWEGKKPGGIAICPCGDPECCGIHDGIQDK